MSKAFKLGAAVGGLMLGMAALAYPAQAMTVDHFLGSTYLANSGVGTETNYLAGLIGVSPSSLSISEKTTSPSATSVGSGTWSIDVNPETPSYFLLKFGIGGTSVADNSYFFKNLADLGKLVFTDAQINYLMGGGTCHNCGAGRLSHYTLFNVSVVPLPAALPLLGSAVGLFGVFAWRRKRAAAA